MSGLAELGGFWSTIQIWLFPMLEDELGALDDRHREFIATSDFLIPIRNRSCFSEKGLALFRPTGDCTGNIRMSTV